MPTAPITLTTPLAPDELRFDSMSFSAGLSVLEQMQLQMLSDKPDVQPEDLLGKTVEVTIELRDGAQRHVHGYVSRFGLGRHQGRYFGYQAEVVPWLWFLTRRSDCKIFQEMTVPDIVKEIFKPYAAVANHEFKLVRSYRKRTYCVQYRETDFNFVARLLEDEGIYWYFEHKPGEHKLMLVDSSSAHEAVPGYETLPYYANTGQLSPDVDFVSNWNFSRGVASGKVALTSYDFENPGTALKVGLAVQREHDQSSFEQFDFLGDYTKTADGEQLLDNRMDELQARHEQLTGLTNAYGLTTGHLFTLSQHPRGDQNVEYLVVRTQISAQLNGSESGNATGEYRCSFQAMPSVQQYRAPRTTPKPFVQGPQTAVVVGPGGEEIFTDKYGRVKVQFHWDRYGQKNETSSCWMRVSSPWAGKSFGFIQIPRIGQEVVVDFLEGDPDQPLITGRVYNADQMPPWDLPANASQSGLLTRSTKGGAYINANALRFEDKKGAEQIWLQAERNMDTTIEWDETHTVGHDQTNLVLNHQKTNIKKGREVYVEADGETYYVKGKRTIYVDGNQTQTITQNYDTFTTQNRGDYTDGKRTIITNGTYSHKSGGATNFDCGPLFGVQAGDIKFKPSGLFGVDAGGDFHAKASNFRFTASGNMDFTCNNFNRVIFQGNDTVLGPNTNTYIGVSRDVAVGPATEVWAGMHNSAAVGIDMSAFLGLQISNFIGLSLSNAVALQISNSGINMGITGIDLTMSGLALTNNGFYMINSGSGSGAGAGSVGPMGVGSALAAGVYGLVAMAAGAAAAVSAASQAKDDVDKLLNDPTLTPAVRARLKKALTSPFSLNTTSTSEMEAQNESETAAQLQRLGEVQANPDFGKVPGAPPTIPIPPPADANPPDIKAPPTPGDPTAPQGGAGPGQ